jgi:hypothetical protein
MPLARMWCTIRVIKMARDTPRGCPTAIAPPSGLSLAWSAPVSASQARGTLANESVAADTYPYFDFLLEGHRVWREPLHGVVMVAGHEEVLAVLRDTASFQLQHVAGPSFRFPVELIGDDVTSLVEVATRCR